MFTAPVAELILVSFTVPLVGRTFAATAAVVTSCSSSADFPAAGVFASRCRVVVVFYSWWCLQFCLGQCEAGDWKFFLFPVSEVVGCVCMLNYWFSSNADISPDNCNFLVHVEGQVSQWEVGGVSVR